MTFDGRFAWDAVSTSTVVIALRLDRGLWNTWRSRGILPRPLPAEWFRRSSGQPLVYRADAILCWLAHRHGISLDALGAWRADLARAFGEEVEDPVAVRRQAQFWARHRTDAGGDFRFTPRGRDAFLASILAG